MKKSNLNSRITTTNAGRERMNVSGTGSPVSSWIKVVVLLDVTMFLSDTQTY